MVEVPEKFYGRYKLTTSENFDNFLKEIGVGFLSRNLANSVYPVVELGKDENNNFFLKSQTKIKNSEVRFKLGEEFEENRLDGKTVKSTFNLVDDNLLIQTQRDGNQEIKYIREFTGDQIKVTSIANNVKSLRIYDRIKE